MISKENFINVMVAIKAQREIDNIATKALDLIFEDIGGGFYRNEVLFSGVEQLLISEMSDENEWIMYFIYDLDWGKAWTNDSCSEKDDTIIDISTIEKLYDYLIKTTSEKGIKV